MENRVRRTICIAQGKLDKLVCSCLRSNIALKAHPSKLSRRIAPHGKLASMTAG